MKSFLYFSANKEEWDNDWSRGKYENLTAIESKEYYLFINPLCRKDIFNGKLDLVKNLCEKNYKFLDHMFRYNQTLKAFEEILEKGHFDVLNQYDTNVVWHYFKDNHNSYTEKQGNYIGHLESRSKLDYFPTNYEIQYKALPYVTDLVMKDTDFIRKSTLKFIDKYVGENINVRKIYTELIKMGRYDIIDECYNVMLLIVEMKTQQIKLL